MMMMIVSQQIHHEHSYTIDHLGAWFQSHSATSVVGGGGEGGREGLSECCFHFLSMFRLVLSLFFWFFFSQKTT